IGGGGQDVGTSFTTGGLTWTRIPLHADGMYFAVSHEDPRTLYFESQEVALRKSVDGGRTFTDVVGGLTGSRARAGVIAMDPVDASILFTGTTMVFMTVDACATNWQPVSRDLRSYVSAIAISPVAPLRLYMGTGNTYYRTGPGRVFRSDNGCDGTPDEDWTERTGTLRSARPAAGAPARHT